MFLKVTADIPTDPDRLRELRAVWPGGADGLRRDILEEGDHLAHIPDLVALNVVDLTDFGIKDPLEVMSGSSVPGLVRADTEQETAAEDLLTALALSADDPVTVKALIDRYWEAVCRPGMAVEVTFELSEDASTHDPMSLVRADRWPGQVQAGWSDTWW